MKMQDKDFLKGIVRIEQGINSLLLRADNEAEPGGAFCKAACNICGADLFGGILDNNIKELSERQDLEIVDEHLRKRGYINEGNGKKKGTIDYAKFYTDAYIEQSVWTRYYNGTNRTSNDSLLKIVLGLRMNDETALRYLPLAGGGFSSYDMVDLIIHSYIINDYLGDETIEEIIHRITNILNFYSDQEVKAGRKKLRNFYKDI